MNTVYANVKTPIGPIVRIAPNTLSINTISGLREIYGSRKSNVQKADWYRSIDAASGAFSTHSEIDRDKHAFRRRVLDHAFSDSAVRSVEPYIIANVRAWCKYLGDGSLKPGSWNPAKNMSDWCTYLGYDIMGDLTFGKRFNCIESEEHRYVPGLMMASTKFIYVVCAKLNSPILRQSKAQRLKYDSGWFLAYHQTYSAIPRYSNNGCHWRPNRS